MPLVPDADAVTCAVANAERDCVTSDNGTIDASPTPLAMVTDADGVDDGETARRGGDCDAEPDCVGDAAARVAVFDPIAVSDGDAEPVCDAGSRDSEGEREGEGVSVAAAVVDGAPDADAE